MRKPVGERPVVREQQRAGGVGVQPPDRHDARLVPDELRRPSAAPEGRAQSSRRRRLVEQDVRERLRLDEPAVDLDLVACSDDGVQLARHPVDDHAAAP